LSILAADPQEGFIVTTATAQTAEESKLAALIVEALNLELTPQEVDPGAPLYRDGLGLDSIDILEIALVISKTYGVQLKADDADNVRIFGSLRSLNEHLQQHRTK
jgi:acyl carrier protein